MWGIACFNGFRSLSESNFWSQQFWCIDFQPHTCLVNKISSQALVCVSKSFLLRQIKYFTLQVLTAFVLNCMQASKGRGSKLQGRAEPEVAPVPIGAPEMAPCPRSLCQLSAAAQLLSAPGQCQPWLVPGLQHRGAWGRLAAAAGCWGQAKLCSGSQAALRMSLS